MSTTIEATDHELKQIVAACHWHWERGEPNKAIAKLRNLLATQRPPEQAVPAEWKLVPIEPSETMLKSAYKASEGYIGPCAYQIGDAWSAMLSAAPTPFGEV